jgi:D-alanine-D-alanine ligase
MDRIKKLSVETFTVLECRGMARVDMFLTPEDDLIINEINTIPGFTNISMYPKLWEASGLKQTDLVSKLISLAIEEHNAVNKLLMV